MKITKKILSVVMTVMMIMSLMICSYAASFSDVEATHSNYAAITTLADMGIINGYTDGTFKPDNAVTRAEMAKLISVLYGYDVATVAKSPFTDVADDHWAVTFISTMKDVGIINGMGDGTFLPNNEVTYEQCLKMIVCALNWGEIAAQASTPDDWSLGYRQHATRLGITKYVSVESNSSPAPRGVVAQLLYNSLDAKRAEKVVDANGQVSFKESDGSVSDELSLYELKGARIISTPKYNIDGEFIKDGYIRLVNSTGKEYEMSVGSYNDLLDAAGRYVDIKYNVDTNDNMTISSRTLLGTTETIDVKKVKDVADSYIEYYVDEDFERTKKITIDNPAVIYNNRVLKNTGDFDTLLKGDITSTSSDAPLNYFGNIEIVEHASGDLITAKIYKTYYMSTAVDSKNFMVKFDTKDAQVYIPVSNRENYEIIKKTSLTATGSTPSSISISTNSVVSICMSPDGKIYGTNYIEYIPSTSKKSGSPTDITDNGSRGMTVVIDKKTYVVANEEIKSDFEIGSSTTYMVDASGAIVYTTEKSSGNKKFVLFKSAGSINDNDKLPVTFSDIDSITSEVKVTIDAKKKKKFSEDAPEKAFIDFLSENREELLWIDINTNNEVMDIELASKVTSSHDSNLTAAVVYNSGTSVELSGSYYVLTGATVPSAPTRFDESSTTVIIRPGEAVLSSNNVIYTKSTLKTELPYDNAKIYEIKKGDKKIRYVIVDNYKGLYDSAIYVVKAEPKSSQKVGDVSYFNLDCYNFKTGAEKTLKIVSSVKSALGLKEGDIFTMYADCDIKDVDIDKTSNIFILMRASELAANKASAASLDALTNKDTDNASFDTKRNGFKVFGIDSGDKDLTGTYYSASLQLPMYINKDENKLYLTRKHGDNSTAPGSLTTYVHGDDNAIADLLTAENYFGPEAEKSYDTLKSAFGNSVIDVKVTSSTRVFIYDSSSADGQKLTFYKSPSDSEEEQTLTATWDAITTLQELDNTSADAFKANLPSASLTYGYFTGGTSSSTLNALFIIK